MTSGTLVNRAQWDRLDYLAHPVHLEKGVVQVMMESEVFKVHLVIWVCLDTLACLDCLERKDTGAFLANLVILAVWDLVVKLAILVIPVLLDQLERWVPEGSLDQEVDRVLQVHLASLVVRVPLDPRATRVL